MIACFANCSSFSKSITIFLLLVKLVYFFAALHILMLICVTVDVKKNFRKSITYSRINSFAILYPMSFSGLIKSLPFLIEKNSCGLETLPDFPTFEIV